MKLRTFELQFNIFFFFNRLFFQYYQKLNPCKTRLDCLSSRKTERVKCKFNHDDIFGNIVPRVFSLFNMAAVYWKERRPWGRGCIFC